MQQCYIKLWINLDNLDSESEMLPLLFSYAKNLMIDDLRKMATEKKHFQHLQLTQEKTTSTEPDLWTARHVQQINNAIVRMPVRRRKVFLLRKEEGLTVNEIAEKLNITPRAVRKHLSEAVDYLRNNLAGMDVVAILFLFQLQQALPLLSD